MSLCEIRDVEPADAAPLTDIFNHYIEHAHSSFDEAPVSVESIANWVGFYGAEGQHRLLVAVEAGTVVGYASGSAYRAPHLAFRHTIEVSIQLAPGVRGRGIGTQLYAGLFDALQDQPIHRALAGVALPNPASVALHRRFGFREVGVFNEYAIKNGGYISSAWMEKAMNGEW